MQGLTAAAAEPAATKAPKDAVDSRDIDLVQAFYAYVRAAPGAKSAKAAALAALVEQREAADARFAEVFGALPATGSLGSADPEAARACENDVIATAERACGAFDSYSLKFTQPLQALCHKHAHAHIAAELSAACTAE